MAEDENEKAALEELNRKSLKEAIRASCLPVYISRFEILPNAPFKDHIVLTLGGGISGNLGVSEEEKEEFAVAEMHGAYIISKDFARQLVEHLEATFNLTVERQVASDPEKE